MILRTTIILVLMLMLLASLDSLGQCAMCRQNAEYASEGNSGFAEGLNSGITFLMLMPYLIMATLALIFWRKKIYSFIRS